jgi:hypothetical protein
MPVNWKAMTTLVFGLLASSVAGVAAWYASESAIFVAVVVCVPLLLALAALFALLDDRIVR